MIDLDGVIDLCANDLYGQQGRCIQSAAAYSVEDVELSEEFKEHYHLWLEEEVYSMEINWDALMVKVE